jgi:hypothetical protein
LLTVDPPGGEIEPRVQCVAELFTALPAVGKQRLDLGEVGFDLIK